MQSCTNNTGDRGTPAFTLSTGINAEFTQCLEPKSEPYLKINFETKKQTLLMSDYFDCNAKKIDVYLKNGKDNRATLVMQSASAHSGCECLKNVKVEITNRLERENVLYVVNNSEVLGHVIVR
jgi:hypothetical protein